MKRRELLAVLAAGAIVENSCSQAQESEARYAHEIALPKPSVAGAVSLEQAIERRRSVRSFGSGPLPVGTIGQLLWAGQGTTSADGKRAAPSAGALYALERLSQRYGDRANAYADLEVGHAAQNMLLQAVALGLAAVPVASLDGTRAARTLALSRGQTVVYLIPVGFAA